MSTLRLRSVSAPDRVAKVTWRKTVLDQEFVGVSYKQDDSSFNPHFICLFVQKKEHRWNGSGPKREPVLTIRWERIMENPVGVAEQN